MSYCMPIRLAQSLGEWADNHLPLDDDATLEAMVALIQSDEDMDYWFTRGFAALRDAAVAGMARDA